MPMLKRTSSILPQARAKVNQFLSWRQASFYPAIGDVVYPCFGWGGDAASSDAALPKLAERMEEFVNFYLKGGKFIGDRDAPTIADLSIAPAIEFLRAKKGYEFKPEVSAYLQRVEGACPSYKEHMAGLRGMADGAASK